MSTSYEYQLATNSTSTDLPDMIYIEDNPYTKSIVDGVEISTYVITSFLLLLGLVLLAFGV